MARLPELSEMQTSLASHKEQYHRGSQKRERLSSNITQLERNLEDKCGRSKQGRAQKVAVAKSLTKAYEHQEDILQGFSALSSDEGQTVRWQTVGGTQQGIQHATGEYESRVQSAVCAVTKLLGSKRKKQNSDVRFVEEARKKQAKQAKVVDLRAHALTTARKRDQAQVAVDNASAKVEALKAEVAKDTVESAEAGRLRREEYESATKCLEEKRAELARMHEEEKLTQERTFEHCREAEAAMLGCEDERGSVWRQLDELLLSGGLGGGEGCMDVEGGVQEGVEAVDVHASSSEVDVRCAAQGMVNKLLAEKESLRGDGDKLNQQVKERATAAEALAASMKVEETKLGDAMREGVVERRGAEYLKEYEKRLGQEGSQVTDEGGVRSTEGDSEVFQREWDEFTSKTEELQKDISEEEQRSDVLKEGEWTAERKGQEAGVLQQLEAEDTTTDTSKQDTELQQKEVARVRSEKEKELELPTAEKDQIVVEVAQFQGLEAAELDQHQEKVKALSDKAAAVQEAVMAQRKQDLDTMGESLTTASSELDAFRSSLPDKKEQVKTEEEKVKEEEVVLAAEQKACDSGLLQSVLKPGKVAGEGGGQHKRSADEVVKLVRDTVASKQSSCESKSLVMERQAKAAEQKMKESEKNAESECEERRIKCVEKVALLTEKKVHVEEEKVAGATRQFECDLGKMKMWAASPEWGASE